MTRESDVWEIESPEKLATYSSQDEPQLFDFDKE